MEEKYIVYCHENKINGKKYFGITRQEINQRWRNGKGYSRCPRFNGSINKYGWNNFEHIILFTNLQKTMACEIEIYLINKYNTTSDKFGYNIALGGETGSYHEFTEEHKHNLSISHIGIHSGENHPMYGKKHTDLVRKKISEKVEIANKKRGHYPMYGKHHSEETKNNLKKIKSTNPIIQFSLDGEIVKEFQSGREAERETSVFRCGIYNCCKRKENYKTAGGFYWMYKKEYDIYGFIKPQEMTNRLKNISQFTKDGIFIKEYDSLTKASKELGIDDEGIRKCCIGLRKTCGDYIWKYSD